MTKTNEREIKDYTKGVKRKLTFNNGTDHIKLTELGDVDKWSWCRNSGTR